MAKPFTVARGGSETARLIGARVRDRRLETGTSRRELARRIRASAVLQAALDCFVEVGFHAASVRGIAPAARLSVAGVYHHHPSKQQQGGRPW